MSVVVGRARPLSVAERPRVTIEEVYRDHAPRFGRVAYAIVGDAETAEDVVQDAFAKAIVRRGSFRGSGDAGAGIWRIVVNTALSRRRRSRLETLVRLRSTSDERSVEPVTRDDAVRAHVARLPRRQRLALFLHYYADMDYDTIATVLGVAPGPSGTCSSTRARTCAVSWRVTRMRDDRLAAALDSLAPPAHRSDQSDAWADVQRRARRLRRARRRAFLGACIVAASALFSALAASGQIGSFARHTDAPRLVLRAPLARADGARAGSLVVELVRTTIVLGRRVRVLQWRAPGGRYRARWFLRLDDDGKPLARAALVVRGRTLAALCAPCGAEASGEIELGAAQVAALVNDEARFGGGSSVSGRVRLDRSSLQRGVLCLSARAGCTRIYTGRS